MTEHEARRFGLPRLTQARAAALEAMGIRSEEELLAWCAAKLAEAVNEENERTRTTEDVAAMWLHEAIGEDRADEVERIDPATMEGWEDVGVYTVMFQQRETDAGEESSVLVISHHDAAENHVQRWPGWDAAPAAGWMSERLALFEPDEEVEVEPRQAEADAQTSPRRDPHIRAVYAVEGERFVDLRPQAHKPHPMVSPDPHIEVELDPAPPGPIAGELYLTTPSGERHIVELSGRGSMITTDLHLHTGYHTARLVLREAATQREIDFVELGTLLVTEAS